MKDRHYRFTIQLIGGKRHSVGIWALDKYVGKNRADFIRKKAAKLTVDKCRVVVQNKGFCDVYLR